jgi:hypothetical protein
MNLPRAKTMFIKVHKNSRPEHEYQNGPCDFDVCIGELPFVQIPKDNNERRNAQNHSGNAKRQELTNVAEWNQEETWNISKYEQPVRDHDAFFKTIHDGSTSNTRKFMSSLDPTFQITCTGHQTLTTGH